MNPLKYKNILNVIMKGVLILVSNIINQIFKKMILFILLTIIQHRYIKFRMEYFIVN